MYYFSQDDFPFISVLCWKWNPRDAPTENIAVAVRTPFPSARELITLTTTPTDPHNKQNIFVVNATTRGDTNQKIQVGVRAEGVYQL